MLLEEIKLTKEELRLYERYLELMYAHDTVKGYYPPALSNPQWTPFNREEFLKYKEIVQNFVNSNGYM